jgi:hypothetical protein
MNESGGERKVDEERLEQHGRSSAPRMKPPTSAFRHPESQSGTRQSIPVFRLAPASS